MMQIIQYVSLWLVIASASSAASPSANNAVFETFPKMDVHTHYFADVPGLAAALKSINMEALVICTQGSNPETVRKMESAAEELSAKYGTTFRFASTFDLTKRYEPGWQESVKAWLGKSYEQGAVMTKIWKEVGMEFKTPGGQWLMPDDPIFDPIYDFIEKSDKPLLAHLAEPLAAWLPLDPENPHYGYYSKNPEWHFYNKPGMPQHAEIIAARDRILEKHPHLIFIGAHLGSQEHSVDVIATRLDKFKNYYVECAARVADLTRQPKEKVYKFFVKYQDRIMYGTDIIVRSGPPNQKTAAVLKGIEDRYRQDWQYFAGSGTMTYREKKIECLNLPLGVLKKFYKGNAEKVVLKQ